MERNEVTYEWCYEEVDENGDVIDMECQSSLSELADRYSLDEICLIRRVGNSIDGEQDRQYSYIKNGELPTYFSGQITVPNRFHKELKQVKTQWTK